MRPRIRTVKPEMRHDERYSRLSYPARELFNGLITMADDEGRFRAPTSAILGHVFPYDDGAVRKLRDWVGEVRDSGMVVFYVVDKVPYGAFRHWKRHQKINRPRPSTLPPPPDHEVVSENSVEDHDSISDPSRNVHSPTRGCASRSDPTSLQEVFDYWQERCNKPRAKFTRERREKVAARQAEGYTVDDIKRGCDGAATNPPRDKDNGVVYDDLVSICRNGAQLERYMERATAVVPMKREAVRDADRYLKYYDQEGKAS